MSESSAEMQVEAPNGIAGEAAADALEVKAVGQWSYARRRFFSHRLAMFGLVGLVVIFGAGALAPDIAPYRYDAIDLAHVVQAPTTLGHHYFGTDQIGRDYLSRVIYGIRTSEQVGLFVALTATLIGLLIGAAAGYYRSWFDNILMRISDLILTLPATVILLTVAALLAGRGSNLWTICFILAGFSWTVTARVVRGVYLSLREKEYVEAAKAVGAGDLRIMFRHILPNTLGTVVVVATLAVADAIIAESYLSFLGFGVQPPTPSLGNLIADAQQNPRQWWLTVMPGLALVLIVICVNFVGDGLRDALDPQQRRVRG